MLFTIKIPLATPSECLPMKAKSIHACLDWFSLTRWRCLTGENCPGTGKTRPAGRARRYFWDFAFCQGVPCESLADCRQFQRPIPILFVALLCSLVSIPAGRTDIIIAQCGVRSAFSISPGVYIRFFSRFWVWGSFYPFPQFAISCRIYPMSPVSVKWNEGTSTLLFTASDHQHQLYFWLRCETTKSIILQSILCQFLWGKLVLVNFFKLILFLCCGNYLANYAG